MSDTWTAEAEACDGNGAFDAAYSFGNSKGHEGQLTGTPEEIGAELTRLLRLLTPEDIAIMAHGTGAFYLRLNIRPV